MIEIGNSVGRDYMRERGRIPESEMVIDHAASSGPGGQNVNKLETKAVIHWNVAKSRVFSDAEKALIREKIKLTDAGDVYLECDEVRTQLRNKNKAIDRLNAMVAKAIEVVPPRQATEVPKNVKTRNKDSDFRDKQRKSGRGPVVSG
jgi:ribosome-associated protein